MSGQCTPGDALQAACRRGRRRRRRQRRRAGDDGARVGQLDRRHGRQHRCRAERLSGDGHIGRVWRTGASPARRAAAAAARKRGVRGAQLFNMVFGLGLSTLFSNAKVRGGAPASPTAPTRRADRPIRCRSSFRVRPARWRRTHARARAPRRAGRPVRRATQTVNSFLFLSIGLLMSMIVIPGVWLWVWVYVCVSPWMCRCVCEPALTSLAATGFVIRRQYSVALWLLYVAATVVGLLCEFGVIHYPLPQ